MKVRWVLLGILLALLLVPAALLTTARVLEPSGGAWIRLVAFTPFGTVLYAAAALVLLLAWLRGRGWWRAAARLLTVAALLGALLHAFWASGPYVGAPAAEAAGRAELTVMTANLRFGGGDTAAVVEQAQHWDVDVLVLEEVTPLALSRLRAAGVDAAYPHSVGRAQDGPVGTMVFSTHRLTRAHRIHTGFAGYVMTVRAPGGPVRLLAVHPRAPIGAATGWRADQLVVRAAARSLRGPAVLAGDFNATMDHTPMRELVGRGYHDAVTQARSGWQPTWPASGEVSPLGLPVPSLVAIDHVLTRGGPYAVRTETLTIADTDHRALVAVLRR